MTTIINDVKVVEINESDNTLVISTVEKNLIVGDGVKTVTDGTTTVNAPDTIKFVGSTVTTTREGEAVVTVDGGGVAPGPVLSLKDQSIPMWDAATGELVDSGARADGDGHITIAPNSLSFGQHTMSSAIEDVTFTNTTSKKNYSPVWQELTPGSEDAFMRIVGSMEAVVRVPVVSTTVTNPENTVVIDEDEVFLGGVFYLDGQTDGVELDFFNQAGELIWKYKMGTLPDGPNRIIFDVPFKVSKGFIYVVKLTSSVGDIVAKGVDGKFSWVIERAPYRDAAIALKENVTANKSAIDNHTAEILKNGQGVDSAVVKLADLQESDTRQQQKISALETGKADDISNTIDAATKKVTLHLIAENKSIMSTVIDLSPLFGVSPPVTSSVLYFGFSGTKTVTANDAKAGSTATVSSVSGYRVHLTRVTATSAYMFAWLPDSVGAIRGFTFGGFLDTWAGTPLTVDGVVGKVFISDNPTTAKDINFEVTV